MTNPSLEAMPGNSYDYEKCADIVWSYDNDARGFTIQQGERCQLLRDDRESSFGVKQRPSDSSLTCYFGTVISQLCFDSVDNFQRLKEFTPGT